MGVDDTGDDVGEIGLGIDAADRAEKFAAAYRKAGGKLGLGKYAGEPHTFITKSTGSRRRPTRRST